MTAVSIHPVPSHTDSRVIAGLLIGTLAGGLRLSPKLSVFSGLQSGLFFLILVVFNHAGSGGDFMDDVPQVVLFLIFIIATTALGYMVAISTRRHVETNARSQLRFSEARQQFEKMLAEHHDMRSLLSSARINADLIHRKVNRSVFTSGSKTQIHIDNLKRDLNMLSDQVGRIVHQSLYDLTALGHIESVRIKPIVIDVFSCLKRRFPDTRLSVSYGAGCDNVRVMGGPTSLRRILFNLLLNAFQGDGDRQAQTIELQVRHGSRNGWIEMRIIDDGSGFGDPTPDAVPPRLELTSKPDGTGVGLFLVEKLLQLNDSALRRQNQTGSGAIVSFELRGDAYGCRRKREWVSLDVCTSD